MKASYNCLLFSMAGKSVDKKHAANLDSSCLVAIGTIILPSQLCLKLNEHLLAGCVRLINAKSN